MRTIITALFLIVFSQSAGALTNQDLYEYCKPYADAAFDFSKMEDPINSIVCITYFTAIGSLIGQACDSNSINYEIDGMKPNYEPQNLDATVQDYVNKISEMPKYWRFDASLAVALSHKNISGDCPNRILNQPLSPYVSNSVIIASGIPSAI